MRLRTPRVTVVAPCLRCGKEGTTKVAAEYVCRSCATTCAVCASFKPRCPCGGPSMPNPECQQCGGTGNANRCPHQDALDELVPCRVCGGPCPRCCVREMIARGPAAPDDLALLRRAIREFPEEGTKVRPTLLERWQAGTLTRGDVENAVRYLERGGS